MSVEIEKNIYGLSEGVFKACQFLGLKFPAALDGEHIPSDYFGDNFELDEATIKKLCAECKCSQNVFAKNYKTFAEKFMSQKPLKQAKTDLNVYFCDYLLFSRKYFGTSDTNYFDFEFYTKSFEEQRTFRTDKPRRMVHMLCNEPYENFFVKNKVRANKLFSEFLHRNWLDASSCTFEQFKFFVEKHPRFFSKKIVGLQGIGSEIIQVESNQNLDELFARLKKEKKLLEELIVQHVSLQEFYPHSVNTIRINTFLDIHNVAHILTCVGRFGSSGKFTDNFTYGGYSCAIDPKTGIVVSDGLNRAHERLQKHPDTGKTFRGFQYPCWDKIRAVVKKAARLIPRVRHVGWDVTVNINDEVLIIEANEASGVGVQQAADGLGKMNLYSPLVEEMQNYKKAEMKLLGYRVNNLRNFDSAYNTKSRSDDRLKLVLSKLIPDCKSLLDLGCRAKKAAKQFCPEGVQYLPVDYKKHDNEVIHWEFSKDKIFTPPSQIAADVCLCAFTAEFAEYLPQFLNNMCNATQKQILMLCRPADLEEYPEYRWKNPFLTDFTEEFLIKTLAQNNFRLNAKEFAPNHRSVVIYDFRRI